MHFLTDMGPLAAAQGDGSFSLREFVLGVLRELRVALYHQRAD
jgi:hypothetical protein